MKLLTSTAALEAIGPDHRFETTVRRVPGTNRIVLVGGGDPFLQSRPTTQDFYPHRADIQSLARRTARALRADGTRKVRLAYDDSFFRVPARRSTGRRRTSEDGVVPPITALWVDEGRSPTGFGYVDDPSRAAGLAFRAALAKQGIRVVGELAHQKAPGGARDLALVQSPTLGRSWPGWCWSATTTPPRWWRTTWARRCARTPRSRAVRSPSGRCCTSSVYLSRTP
jgi:D-alanyl-D-alanine carboxypeptidase/D-alanyl-D-alanine-endopeptidase (penicillin-binding protein 4)